MFFPLCWLASTWDTAPNLFQANPKLKGGSKFRLWALWRPCTHTLSLPTLCTDCSRCLLSSSFLIWKCLCWFGNADFRQLLDVLWIFLTLKFEDFPPFVIYVFINFFTVLVYWHLSTASFAEVVIILLIWACLSLWSSLFRYFNLISISSTVFHLNFLKKNISFF